MVVTEKYDGHGGPTTRFSFDGLDAVLDVHNAASAHSAAQSRGSSPKAFKHSASIRS